MPMSIGFFLTSFTHGHRHVHIVPAHAPVPAHPPEGMVHSPNTNVPTRHHHHRHHHKAREAAAPPTTATDTGCNQICTEPLTLTPYGSPCACVFPMKVKLLLDVDLYTFFPLVNELEIEIADGTYLKQSQVKIMAAVSDVLNQGRTLVDINLVPLGDKFDNTTATLTYERLWQKKISLNASLFGTYTVVNVSYPGISRDLIDHYMGPGSSPALPISANFATKRQRTNGGFIAIIILSGFVLLFVSIGAMCIISKCRKVREPVDAVDPLFTSPFNKRYGTGSVISNSIASSTSASLMSAMTSSMLSVRKFTLFELRKATEKFSPNRLLGEGGFGRVYHGVLEDGTEVAVKLLSKDNQNGDREFAAEVEMLSRLHHRNLVKLIGICIEQLTRCLVYELVRNGSVESHLHGVDKESQPLDWDARLKIALGAARGLAYLHEDSNPRVIHRDFKASNVLLESDFTPKVSDFGLAREATEGTRHISTRVMGTFGYVAPEYAMTGHLLVKSDVYSYGVVLLELLTGRQPVDMNQPQGHENLVTWARPLLTSREGLQQLVDPSLQGKFEFDDMAKVAAIASMCVHPEVTQRPFMGEVVQALKLIYNDNDAACEDCCSQKESSTQESDYRDELDPSDGSWWNATPRLTYGHASSFITMEYCESPLDGMGGSNPLASPNRFRKEVSLPIMHGNRSGPLTTMRSKRSFYRLKGCISDHARLLSRRDRRNDSFPV
uniref:Protein kinase domain-containing protein n=1 Tax=Kalanchoe fedtschenkoi TaxID=63787 RepID=A0A7N0SYG2_KALFE